MKVGLITLHRVLNYGSVLQTYATQQMICSLGLECETIDYMPPRMSYKNLVKSAKMGKGRKVLFAASMAIRKVQFNRFLKKYVVLSKKKYKSSAELKETPPEADIYMTGSDQTWNSFHNGGIDEGNWLCFGQDNIRRVAFVASFGKQQLDTWEIDITRELLKRYYAVSVRETSGAEIVASLGLDRPQVLLDPTLQISGSEWAKIANRRLVKGKYLLIYQLGEDNGIFDIARKIADGKGLKVVRLCWQYKKDPRVDIMFTHRKPEDFLSLFLYADYIVTNSFHGTAFSINMNKQFTVVGISKFQTRIDSILNLTQLQSRFCANYSDYDPSAANSIIDYNMVNAILDSERKKAKEFLIRACGASVIHKNNNN